MDLEAVKGRIADVHRGRKWILVGDVAAAFTPMVDQLREWDVADIMIVAGVEGVGDLPNADSTFLTHTSGETMMLGFRAFIRSVEHPSADVHRKAAGTGAIGIVFNDDRATAVDPEDANDATMEIGPATFGTIVMVRFDSDRTPIGPSMANRALQTLDLARELWNVEVPDLEPAPDLCP